MKVTETLHRLRIDFTVTETIKRFVYVYLLVGKRVHVIDTGVDGSELLVRDTLAALGRGVEDIATILLTHTHPDHIGGAAALKEWSGARVLCSAAERPWVEDIEQQFRERPIPNFHRLLNRSTQLDGTLADGDTVFLEEGMNIRIHDAVGHSHGSQVFHWLEEKIVFTGDVIPVAGDIPIYVSAEDSLRSLEMLRRMEGVELYLSAWDEAYDHKTALEKIAQAQAVIGGIVAATKTAVAQLPHAGPEDVFKSVATTLKLERLMDNPLFRRSVQATLQEL